MIALIQRVSRASVTVESEVIGSISKGILILLGVEKEDTEQRSARLVEKILGIRIFSDSDGKMNLNIGQVSGELLVVSQFTLAADTNKGLRPSFASAASPVLGENMYQHFVMQCKQKHTKVETGRFGADMQVELVNDGPVTFSLRV